jgi:hypothetical protein
VTDGAALGARRPQRADAEARASFSRIGERTEP